MFRKLIPELSKDYYVLAPDLPGFRFIDCPPRDRHAYTFLDFAVTLGKFVEKLNLKKFALYCFDYGAPTGYRLALQYPDRISALII
jgi:pimeloyl-ACP methyl ester carboxylesterase